MAHTKQQRKRIRQDTARNTAKTAGRSRIRNTVKKFEISVADAGKTGKSDKGGLAAGFKAAMSALSRGARKGMLSKGAAARKTSRLAARLKALATKA